MSGGLPPQHPSARLTPYELVFTEGDFESRIFPMIEEEASVALESLSRDRFDFVRAAGDVVREVTPPEAPAEASEQYRALLFHAFHFWSEDRRLYVLDAAAARYLVESDPDLRGWRFSVPSRTLYLQLPANLFWSSVAPGEKPEPVDGFFVTRTYGTNPRGEPYEHLDVLVILGIYRSRAGFSVITLETELGEGISDPWSAEPREGGDFANVLPGGELSGLYSLLTIGEVLKLLARAMWYIESFPHTQEEVAAPELREAADEPPSSGLSHVRVRLAGGETSGSPASRRESGVDSEP